MSRYSYCIKYCIQGVRKSRAQATEAIGVKILLRLIIPPASKIRGDVEFTRIAVTKWDKEGQNRRRMRDAAADRYLVIMQRYRAQAFFSRRGSEHGYSVHGKLSNTVSDASNLTASHALGRQTFGCVAFLENTMLRKARGSRFWIILTTRYRATKSIKCAIVKGDSLKLFHIINHATISLPHTFGLRKTCGRILGVINSRTPASQLTFDRNVPFLFSTRILASRLKRRKISICG